MDTPLENPDKSPALEDKMMSLDKLFIVKCSGNALYLPRRSRDNDFRPKFEKFGTLDSFYMKQPLSEIKEIKVNIVIYL